MSTTARQHDVGEIKRISAGKWPEILSVLGGVGAEFLDGKHHPCPKCGGRDRFRLMGSDSGAVICGQCFHEKNGDGIAALMWLTGWSFSEAVRELEKWHNLEEPRANLPEVQKRNRPNLVDSSRRREVARYDYCDAVGNLLYQVVRCEPKTFRQRRPDPDGGWIYDLKNITRVLYRLPELLIAGTSPVFFCEGEKDVDCLAGLGLTATTSGSSGSWNDRHATYFKGRAVVILPDNDDPGRKYADTVAKSLRGKTRSLKVVELPGLLEAGDVSDWLDAGHTIEELLAIIEQTEEWTPEQTAEALTYKPFPTKVLPKTVRQYVKECAAEILFDDAMVALPMLTVMGTAIGDTFELRLTPTWTVHPSLWTCTVAESGSRKSPGFDAAKRLFDPIEKELDEKFRDDWRRHKEDVARYDVAFADWKKEVRSGTVMQPPTEPEPPAHGCLTTGDVTYEAVVDILRQNPHGIAIVCPELSGFIAGLDCYRAAKGKEGPFYLACYDAAQHRQHRKGEGSVVIERAIVSITGTIQPSVLRAVVKGNGIGNGELVDNGFLPRFILASPPIKAKRWNTPRVSQATIDAVQALIRDLVAMRDRGGCPAIDFDPFAEPGGTVIADPDRVPRITLTLSPEAETIWGQFVDDHGDETHSATGPIKAVWSKLENVAARLALVFHVVGSIDRGVSPDDIGPVTVDAVRAGITIARWAGHEARRLYDGIMIGDNAIDTDRRDLVELIVENGGSITARELTHKKWKYRGSGEAERALNELVSEGIGTWTALSPDRQGRPKSIFSLQ